MAFFADLLRAKTPFQRRILGAIWQRRLKAAPSSGRPLVVLAIPLVSKRRATDWEQVSGNLARTIASLRAQSCDDWIAIVCGQDRPDGILFDAQVAFLEFQGGDKFYDKGDKRLAILEHVLRTMPGRDGYYAQFDADDLLHPAAIEHVVGSDNGRGYLIDSGYMADLAARKVAPLSPSSEPMSEGSYDVTRAFWQLCGSCVFARFDFRHQPVHWRKLLKRLKSHKRMADVMAQHGLPLDPVPFPAAIYTLNHGENMSRRRNRESWRNGYLDHFALQNAEASAVLREFGQ